MTVHDACDLDDACRLNIEALSELSALILQIPASYYCTEASRYCGPVGAQVRHVIEFYQGFIHGLEQGNINYDTRSRQVELASSPTQAREAIQGICNHLEELEDRFETIRFQASGANDQWFDTTSNLQREMLFLLDHTAHHKAIISLLLEPMGIEMPDGFGLALATKQYQQNRETLPD